MQEHRCAANRQAGRRRTSRRRERRTAPELGPPFRRYASVSNVLDNVALRSGTPVGQNSSVFRHEYPVVTVRAAPWWSTETHLYNNGFSLGACPPPRTPRCQGPRLGTTSASWNLTFMAESPRGYKEASMAHRRRLLAPHSLSPPLGLADQEVPRGRARFTNMVSAGTDRDSLWRRGRLGTVAPLVTRVPPPAAPPPEPPPAASLP